MGVLNAEARGKVKEESGNNGTHSLLFIPWLHQLSNMLFKLLVIFISHCLSPLHTPGGQGCWVVCSLMYLKHPAQIPIHNSDSVNTFSQTNV